MNKIIRPKLEKGNKPSGWSPLSVWTSSLIKQTADAVTIQVEQEIQGLSGLTSRVGTLEVTASAITQDVQALSATTTGMTQQIGNLTVQSDSISASVTTLEGKVANTNLFPLNGWKDNFDKYIEVDSDQRYSGSTGSSAITSPTIYLEKGTYTLSAWESSNKAFTGAQPTPSGTLVPSGNKTTLTGLENTYKNIQRTYVNVTITTAGNYYFKIESGDFYKPKLETGNTPTPYSNQTVDHHSLIQQTDSSISLKVVTEVENQGLVNETQLKETGIDITNGTITLSADKTTVKGNLELKDSDQGLSVYLNDLEKVNISNRTMGTIDVYDFGSDKRVVLDVTTGATNGYADWQLSLGNLSQSEKIYVHNIKIGIALDNDWYSSRNLGCSYTISLKQDNNVITGTTGTLSEYVPGGYELPDFTYNSVPTTGAYTLHITVTPTFTSTQGSQYMEYWGRAYFERLGQGINRIGQDGACFAQDTDEYEWFGADKTVLKRGIYEMVQSSTSGIVRNDISTSANATGGQFGDISTTIPMAYINSLSYTPTALDGLIVFSTVIGQSDDAQRTLTLPSPSSVPAGKWYKVKNICGNNTVVTCTQENKIVYFDDHGWHTSSNIGDDMYSFINTGYEWLEGK
jgi:hypothetical protein